MSEEKKKSAESDINNRDIKNPADRDALKRAADDFLKQRKEEAKAEVEDDQVADEGADPVAAMQAENDELKDQVLRLAAEMENLRRRTARDVADARAYSVANFARDMLQVSDNLNRALQAIPDGAREKDTGLNALAEGVEMTERAMMAALERNGVKKIEPEGQKFDPNFHQAMFEIPNADVPNNTVQQVVQAGYVIGDRVLRPAMVGVSKGGPKEATAKTEPQNDKKPE
ncbi:MULTISPECIES: nucleotide exchange factor GrpE [Bartonella]|uniref:nucleotide exchange factor GrpE n=1 Tax=Bartonella TaxID=773 RepID=UPI0018DD0076|nr:MULTISPECIES: nucleotide exchange factor GrpE [Bartonella]MBH9995463.1 nucleotide exchange factor GrpE [Bartonella sp. P0291]MBH9996193.1 nucleotide exchange factor GrpE [Bartonella sp. M0192]MBH9998354.1 nucleotide exchange factor GrpE [Bartonella sp. M0191]MBI0009046.1 nucleotide exchange factor GrpE [Bartonella sp. M0193]MBI0009644.1 nucleotide exchange factor GrpE [Bartonella sp. M0176]